MDNEKYIYLSPPHINQDEVENVCSALNSGWISPSGSFVKNFTEKLSHHFNKKVLLTNSGTSSIHLALRVAGVKEGDFVLCSDFTFAATAFPILYQKAIPVFIGSETDTWNLSPEFLDDAILDLKKRNIYPKAIIIAHIYGMPAKMDQIINICNNNNIIIIEDAAEALGSHYRDIPLGNLGDYGILSFNGNKIITCSTGGALILPDDKFTYAEKLANQAKEKVEYYKHDELGYNYAQSNILAAIGSAQFNKLNDKITRRREIFNYYLSFFNNKKINISYQQEYQNSFSNRWLSSFIFPISLNKKIKTILSDNNIESRYLWNPLYKQTVFKDYWFYGDKKLEDSLFKRGLSLPSGDSLDNNDLHKITNILDKYL